MRALGVLSPRRGGLAVVATLLTCYQGPPHRAPDARRQNPITHGELDPDDPGVVSLGCTGTLAGSRRLVITAGHCVESRAEMRGSLVAFGLDSSHPDHELAIADVRVHPEANQPEVHSNDIALILLAEPAPSGIEPWPLNRTAFDSSFIGLPLRLAGFGDTHEEPPSSGVKHTGWTTIAEYDDRTFLFHPDPSQTCGGDSGGPGFITLDGVEYLAGVTSTGDAACSEFGRDTRVDVFAADFIEPYLLQTAEGAAGLGDPCYYPEHCGVGECLPARDDERLSFCSVRCSGASDCPTSMVCTGEEPAAWCRYPEPSPGAIGASCRTDADCMDELCARDEPEGQHCRDRCVVGLPQPCGRGLECVELEPGVGLGACVPRATARGGGCASSSGPPSASLVIVVAWLMLLVRGPKLRVR